MSDLNKERKKSLRKASTRELEAVFQRIKPHLIRSRWLSPRNDYRTDCIKKLRDHTQAGKSVNCNDLAEYIAVSAPLHCTDGWITLGRALDAVARDDPSTAVHLSYYAELRASMSLLAAQGIGIFEDRHFVVTPDGKCEPIGKLGKKGGSDLKTHNVAWQALEYWAGLTRSAGLFRNIIQPSGIPLGTWLDAFGAGSLSRPIGMRWLKTWGVDLKRLSKGVDRDARNQASYRPTYFDQGNALAVLDCSGFIRKLWRLLEPTQPSKFDAMDRHLLRLTLRQAFNALPKTRKYEDRVSAMLNTIFPDGILAETWLRFLTGITEPEDPLLITEAASKSASNNPRYHLQILSRAALLLRVATGACLKLLRSGPSGHSELEFWWRPLGERHGIWEPGEELFDLTELWADVNAAVEDLQAWEDGNTGVGTSYTAWRNALPRQISTLGECERAALWGLGL